MAARSIFAIVRLFALLLKTRLEREEKRTLQKEKTEKRRSLAGHPHESLRSVREQTTDSVRAVLPRNRARRRTHSRTRTTRSFERETPPTGSTRSQRISREKDPFVVVPQHTRQRNVYASGSAFHAAALSLSLSLSLSFSLSKSNAHHSSRFSFLAGDTKKVFIYPVGDSIIVGLFALDLGTRSSVPHLLCLFSLRREFHALRATLVLPLHRVEIDPRSDENARFRVNLVASVVSHNEEIIEMISFSGV